jgi:hypothetical protein
VKSISVEVFALIGIRVGEVTTLENRILLLTGRSARDLIIDTRVVISERKSATIPSPLQRPLAVGQMLRHGDRDLARLSASIGGSRVATVRVVHVIRLASTDFVAINLLHIGVKDGMVVGLIGRRPS